MFASPHQELLEASHLFASPDDHRLSFASASSSGSPPHQPQHGGSSSSTGAVRRPPRKSTLTQQQKNQKRQRATQDQLVTLEYEFNKNPTPTAVVRDRIAQEINMTERSVQIWFQNRRAKIKLLAKKSLENGEDVESIPESVRLYLAHQNPDMKALAYGMTGTLNGYGNGYPNGEQSGNGKIFIHHFTCRSLNIGSWRRIGQNAMDLVVFYSPEKACITYYINNDSAGYKIEYPFRKIKSIELETLNVPMAPPNNPGVQQAQLVIQLLSPPHFFMDTSGSGGFVQCGDFTEDQQATQILTHTLGGNAKSLQQQLSKLLNLDVYQNRHRPQPAPFMFDGTFAAPPSPPLRPSSASGMMAPPSLVQQEARGNHVINPYRHKRQRSRSVPNINEFPHFGPMPSFQFDDVIIEPENEDFFLANSVSPKLKMEDGSPASANHLFAPAPQHPHAVSNNLRIDTSAPGFLDYRPTYPLSAATTASVSEYAASPGFPGQIPNELAMTPGLHSPFIDQPWLSPMINPNGLVPQSVSPLSALSNGDPIIASGSPPFIDRTGSADLFPLTHEQALYANDELTDLYAKQSLTMHQQTPPALEDIEDVESHLTPYNLSPMGQPVTLSPEQHQAVMAQQVQQAQ